MPALPAAASPCRSPTQLPNPATTALGWIAEVVRHRGVLGALGYYSGATLEFLRDLTPQRRRSRYGDTDYDFDHHVDTTWATVSFRTRLRELMSGAQYQASEPELFHQILRALPVSPEGFTFIDLGSGKGRTLLMASDYPFRRIIGVELLDELHQIARRNIASYHSEQQKCFDIEAYSARCPGIPVSARAARALSIQSLPRLRLASSFGKPARERSVTSTRGLRHLPQSGTRRAIQISIVAPGDAEDASVRHLSSGIS